MARPKKTIKALMEKDREGNIIGERSFFKSLWRTSVTHENDMMRHFPNISNKRLKMMFRDGWIVRKGKYITLGKKGEEYLRNSMGMKYKYRTNPTHFKHDLILNRRYLQMNEQQRESWHTETQERHKLQSQDKYQEMFNHPKWGNPNDKYIRKNFIPDATVWSEKLQQRIVIEAVTSTYSSTDVDQKCETARVFYNNHIYLVRS